METIYTKTAPDAIGPYSQAIKVGNTLYSSGQIAINPAEGKIVATTIEEQAEQCCRNVEAVLKEAGTDMSHVVKTTCFLAEIADFKAFFIEGLEIADFKAFNEVYAKHFISKPARSCVAVKDLPAGALCEVEVTAVL